MRKLAELQRHEANAHIVHYSCEDFDERVDGSSPRITSLAIRNVDTERTRSFSIHQLAERHGVALGDIASHYDKLEKLMLDEFYEFVRNHQNDRWVHWNMRDTKFGFPAIEHRYRVLGGAPTEIDDSRKYNLASLLIDLFSPTYVKNPRLTELMKLNKISERDFLPGDAEAAAFANGEFVKLHHSTLRKVDNIANIYERTVNGTLKTNARCRDVYGGVLPYLVGHVQEHWGWVIFTLVAGIASIVSLWMTL